VSDETISWNERSFTAEAQSGWRIESPDFWKRERLACAAANFPYGASETLALPNFTPPLPPRLGGEKSAFNKPRRLRIVAAVMKTTAIVFASAGNVEVRDVTLPPLGADEAQVRTSFSAISAGTEGWCLRDQFTWAKTPFPCVPGYQRAGVITEIGAAVKHWKVGDRVMATLSVWKNGVSSFWGAHAAVANTSEKELYRIPDGVDEREASVAVVAQVGYNAAYRPTLQRGDWVVVFGDGLIGQFGAQAAKSRGANVILVGRRADRLALAAKHSAHHVVASGADTVEKIRAITGSKHVAVVIDTVQSEASQKEYLPLLENGRGQIVYSGFSPDPAWANMAWLQQRELTAHFVAGWNRQRMEATLALMAQKKIQFAPLVTHRVPFTRASEMYRMIADKTEAHLGVVLEWK
jgi:L-iditol 2-dehydrogenase